MPTCSRRNPSSTSWRSLANADPVDVPPRPSQGPARPRRHRGGGEEGGLEAGRAGDGSKGRGIGFAKYKNLATYVAVIAEVEVDRASGKVSVPRAWAAVDAGQIINPDGLANQIEGGIVQSTSWTLKEEVKFDRDGIRSRDWAHLSDPHHAGGAHRRGRADRSAGRRARSAPARPRKVRRSRRSPTPSPPRPASGCATCR